MKNVLQEAKSAGGTFEGEAIADLFVSVPTSVIPINIQIIIALAMGVLLNKKNINKIRLWKLILLYLD